MRIKIFVFSVIFLLLVCSIGVVANDQTKQIINKLEFYDPKPDICEDTININKYDTVRPGKGTSFIFTVKNIGDQGSVLYWELLSKPDWMDIDFRYSKPEPVTWVQEVTVTFKAPNKRGNFEGDLVVKEVGGDEETASVKIICSTKLSGSVISKSIADLSYRFQFLKVLSDFLLNIK